MEWYNHKLRAPARVLRKNMTDAERCLWHHLRRKQIYGAQFYRQKPLLNYIVDFYCPQVKLIIELDGDYHKYRLKEDEERTEILNNLGLRVVRFKNEKIYHNLDEVLNEIINNFKK